MELYRYFQWSLVIVKDMGPWVSDKSRSPQYKSISTSFNSFNDSSFKDRQREKKLYLFEWYTYSMISEFGDIEVMLFRSPLKQFLYNT